MVELPKGWVKTRLADVVNYKKGKKPKFLTDIYSSELVDYLDIEGFINQNIRQYADKESSKLAKKNDVLVVWDGARSGLAGLAKEGAIGSTLVCLSPVKIEQKYLLWFIQTKYKYINDNHKGSGIPHVDPEIFWNLQIPLPPLNEQCRIVAKLEQLLAKVESCKQRLEKIPVILKRFRQSVLAAACSGRLTEDWREQNPDIEPALELFSKNIKDELSDFPETWYLVLVGDVIKGLKYGTSQKCSYKVNGVPVLRIPNINEGLVEISDLKYAELNEREYNQLKLEPGDILLIRSNGSVSLVGKTAIVRDTEKGFAYAGYLIRLRPNTSLILSNYLNLALSSYEVRLQIEIPARSTSGVNNINSEEVKNLKIPIPSLAEQQEIVRRVEALFKKADTIEQRYQKAKTYIDQLTQSILAKAFRGELVPQDHNEESAEVLLDRIRSEKAKTDKISKLTKNRM